MRNKRYISLLLTASLIINTTSLPIQAVEITEPAQTDLEENSFGSDIGTDNAAFGTESTVQEQQETEEFVDSTVASAGTTNEEKAQQALQQYLSMTVSEDRSMSLEWWYVMTGKVTTADFSVGENGSGELIFPDSISICSARDMILLSYVNPEAYATSTFTLSADAGTEFDLTAAVTLNEGNENETVLTYQGLGNLEHPFEGTISYDNNSEEITFLLNKSLFIGLSSEAKFLDQFGEKNAVSLVSKTENMFDGLLAQNVLGKTEITADWSVRLSNPQDTDDIVYSLPSLFGTLYSTANVHLTLEDQSSQEPSADGYLCAVMQDDSTLEVKEITREMTVPVVGNLSEKATLTILNAVEETSDSKEENQNSSEETSVSEEDAQNPSAEDTVLEEVAQNSLNETDFNELVEYYRNLTVVPGEMPLEWWFVVSDRLDGLKNYLKWKTIQTDNTEENIALLTNDNSESGNVETQSFDLGNIGSAADLITLSNTDAREYQYEEITITARGDAYDLTKSAKLQNGQEAIFQGLGSDANPFKGTFKYNDASENTYVTLNRPLFNALSTEATVSRVNLACAVQKDAGVNGIFADKIISGDANKELATIVNIRKAENLDNDKTWAFPSLVSSIAGGAKVNLTAAFTGTDILKIDANGFFCNAIESRAEVTVNYPDNMPGVDTARDTVGGLVGTMKSQATLTVADSEKDIVIDIATTGESAGGLVGDMKDGAELSVDVKSLTVNRVSASTANGSYVGSLVATAVNPVFNFGKLTEISAGTPSAGENHLTGYFVGGMLGKMECSGSDIRLNVLPVSRLKIKGNDCGGLFSQLDNSCSTLTIPSSSDSDDTSSDSANSGSTTILADVTVSCTAQSPDTQSVGGLIGWYNPNKDDCKLIANDIHIKIESSGFAYAGGLIGSATGTEAVKGHHDIELTKSNVKIVSSSKDNNLGGLVGSVRERTAYLKVSGVVENEYHKDSQVFGGLVAYADDKGDFIEVGDVDLTKSYVNNCSGSAGGLVGRMDAGVLYMTAKPDLDNNYMITNSPDTRGWILGNRGNVLVCTTAENWFTRTDVEAKDTNDTGVWGQVLQLSKFDKNLVTLNENHTCTVRKAPDLDDNGEYSVSNLTDFAAVALRMQFNEKGLLKFDGGDIEANADVKLKLEKDISLTGTGLTGLTRDKATIYTNTTERHSISIVADENKKITLPDIQVYTVGNNGKSHSHQGLIAEVNDLTLENLTIEGSAKVKSLDNEVRCGIANDIYGNARLENVTSSIEWTDYATNYSSTISGMLTRLVDDNNNRNKEVNIKNCEWNGSIETKCNGSDGRSAAGFIGYGTANKINFEKCTVAGTITKATNDIANLGGLAAVLNQVDSLNIDGLTVSDTVKAGNAANATGGLLGYQWKSDQTTFSGVEVKGAKLYAQKARFGGLVYSGSGYWNIKKDGITFATDNTFDGTSNENKTSGLILADGFLEKNGLYLEVLYDGYKINENAVNFTKTFKYFDELVGTSMNTTTDETVTSGIVSIATSNSPDKSARKIDQNECNTYKDKTTESPYKNPKTRYYYNLDLFRNSVWGENIDTPAKMVLWSAYNSCASNLQNCFKRWNQEKITGTLDLTGYSFYPVPFDYAWISDADITFGFQQLEETEITANNKKPSDTERQHSGMHTGIFTSVVNASQDTPNMQLSVINLKLSGTVGGLNNTYGAIVRGNVQGKDAEHITTLAISGVTLNGIRVYNADKTNSSGSYNVAPLLINSIGSYTTMNLNKVQTEKNQYQTGSGTSVKTVKAASSLIGNVGSDNAAEIKLNFSNMKLAESGESKDKCNIFTHALFLESFKYQSGTCQGTYNFKQDNESGYTLGKEIQNTNSGRNQKQQYWFFGEDGEENEIYKKLNMSGDVSTAFSDFPRYVYVVEDNSTNHELDINLPAVNLEEGCGTYSHPYKINSAGQFKALAEALTDTPKADWKITVTESVLASGSFAEQDGHSKKSSIDVEYKYDYTEKKWISTDGKETKKEPKEIKNYLRNAYYQVTQDITLENWNGLGGSEEEKRFRGVIVGDTENRTITINGGSGTKFGGLIAFSSGSVVKDLTIKYTGTVNVSLMEGTNNTPSSTANASFFGGVVGWCIGGDTIIDNVSVDYKSATITADSPYTAVGGYVGLVGGASDQGGGGVVFRGNVSSTLNQNTLDQYYKNPYVGRVLDGYAVSETQDVDNKVDNYPIPYLTNKEDDSNTPILSINNSEVNVGNAEGLWLFSAMENSRHGSAYSAGKSRSGDYSKIGQPVAKSELIDEKKSGYKETDFYLWKHFNVAQTIPKSALTLNINSDCDMTIFGNAFRGIGVSQGNFVTATGTGTGTGGTGTSTSGYKLEDAFLKIAKVNGNNYTITLAQDRKEHSGESNFWASMGAGLFPIMNCTEKIEIEELTLAGSTNLSAGNAVTGDKAKGEFLFTQGAMAGAGMLAGAVLNNVDNGFVSIDSVEVKGTVNANIPFAGGLIGYCGAVLNRQKQLVYISIKNCKANNSTVVGRTNIGGLIGFTNAKKVTINNFDGNSLEVNANDLYMNLDKGSDWRQDYSNGIGGLFGVVYNGALQFDDVTINKISIENKGTTTKTTTTDIGFGGLVGATNAPKDSEGYMKDICLKGDITITDDNAHVSTGGLIGYLADMNFSGWETSDTQASSLEISDVELGYDGANVQLKGFQAGGLIGMVKDGSVTMTIGGETTEAGGNKTINAVKIGNPNTETPNIVISKNGYSNGNNACLSGIIGITCNNPVITMQNLNLNSIDVQAAQYTSLLIARNAKANTKLTIQHMKADNCKVSVQKPGQSGFLYGCSDTSGKNLTINGYNLMLKKCSIDTNAGALFGGYSNGSTIKLVAVSASDCTGYSADFCNGNSDDSYVIRADYTGTETNTTGSSAPYVPVNPFASGALKDNVNGLTITGDGAAFMPGEEKIAVGKKIAADTQDAKVAKSKIYYNVTEAGRDYNDPSTSEPRISTYSVAGGNATTGQSTSGDGSGTEQSGIDDNQESTNGNSDTIQPDDFPVLLLPAVGKNKVNEAVYKYISLLTNFNSTIASSWKEKLQADGITATTYRWNGSQFAKITGESETCSLAVASDGTISVPAGCYDNTKNQFTLLDVPFKDPTGENNTYHLYIPVVVQKLLNYRFSAAASVGANYYTSHYDRLSDQVLASHEEQVTTLLTYEYERTKAEWQTAIDNGENLLWDFDKKINLVTESNDNLPKETRLTLVDRNNQDKVYFSTYNGSDTTLNFNTFTGYSDDHSYLCDGLKLIASEADASDASGKTQYVKVSDSSRATLRILNDDGKYSYYRPAVANDKEQKYTIEVQGSETDKFLLKEQFYLTIQTPNKSQDFVNIMIQCESNLKNTNGTDMIPNRLEWQENKKYYTRNENENRIVIGDFFKETVTVTSDSDELMSDENNSIKLNIQSVISFINDAWFKRYQDYAKGTSLYQRFDLQLKQWESENSGTAVNFVAGTRMDVKYYKDGKFVSEDGSETLAETAVVGLEFPQKIDFNETSQTSVTLKAEVTLTYVAGGILSQFIERSTATERKGLQFLASSHLAYSEEALKRSSVSGSDGNTKRFYRNNPQAATLSYISDGANEHVRANQLGVNGRVPEENTISSSATYNVKNLGVLAGSATRLQYSIKLLRKNNEGRYEEVSDNSFCEVTDGKITWRNSGEDFNSVTFSNMAGSIKLNGSLNANDPIVFEIPLRIKTGEDFENAGGTYSNYQVQLTVSLYNGDNIIQGSTVSDYIIYTNAKIVTDLIQ